jgi:hypothetical protein
MDKKREACFQPTENDLEEIKNWLIEEWNSEGEGFYCNWNVIHSSFNDGAMVVFKVNAKAVGFAIYQICDVSVIIDIIEVIPSMRKKGIGKELLDCLFKNFICRDKFIVYLQCAPESSESYWRRHGFIDFPEGHLKHDSYSENTWLYKIITPSLKLSSKLETEDSVELWNFDPSLCKNQVPLAFWDISQEINSKLTSPIISPCQADWRLKIVKEKSIVFDGKVKTFDNSLCRDGFLYISNVNRK